MKRFVISLIAILAFGFAQAQESGAKIGVNLGMPVGDASDVTSLSFGADIGYMWNVAPSVDVGLTAGYLNYSGKKYHGEKRDDLSFIPIAATGQFSIMESLFLGADLGYAIGVSPDHNKGGFYYLPKVGYQIDLFEVYLGYKGISSKFKSSENIAGVDFSASKNVDISSVVIGFNYKF